MTTITLTPDQQNALEQFTRFLTDPSEQVFVLEGYSGTGKTTLVKTLLDRLPNLMKTARLINEKLDWAVSIALGHKPEKDFHSHGMTWNGWWETAAYIDTKPNEYRRVPKYSIDWSQGGSIIEREGINTLVHVTVNGVITEWKAGKDWPMSHFPYYTGPTPLIAAMRCYVASKLGDEVEIPEELK